MSDTENQNQNQNSGDEYSDDGYRGGHQANSPKTFFQRSSGNVAQSNYYTSPPQNYGDNSRMQGHNQHQHIQQQSQQQQQQQIHQQRQQHQQEQRQQHHPQLQPQYRAQSQDQSPIQSQGKNTYSMRHDSTIGGNRPHAVNSVENVAESNIPAISDTRNGPEHSPARRPREGLGGMSVFGTMEGNLPLHQQHAALASRSHPSLRPPYIHPQTMTPSQMELSPTSQMSTAPEQSWRGGMVGGQPGWGPNIMGTIHNSFQGTHPGSMSSPGPQQWAHVNYGNHMGPYSDESQRTTQAPSEPDPNRQKYLEKNRQAASRCRNKQKAKVEELVNTARDKETLNKILKEQVAMLQDQLRGWKDAMMLHAGCKDERIQAYIEMSADLLLEKKSPKSGQSSISPGPSPQTPSQLLVKEETNEAEEQEQEEPEQEEVDEDEVQQGIELGT